MSNLSSVRLVFHEPHLFPYQECSLQVQSIRDLWLQATDIKSRYLKRKVIELGEIKEKRND